MLRYFLIAYWRKLLFWGLVLLYAATFIARDGYRGVRDIRPEVLRGPVQSEISDKNIIRFARDDYAYELTPLFDYELNGLVVHAMDYRWFSIFKRDSVFPLDVCVIWGNNVAGGAYRNSGLKFSQDMRFCFWRWTGNISFDGSEISNNHLVVPDKKTEEKLRLISPGDQVQITGKLVNITAKNTGKAGKYDPETFIWNTSTTRSDSAGGACETILVQDVRILKKGNPLSVFLNEMSFYGLIALIGTGLFRFFRNIGRGQIRIVELPPQE